MQYLLMTLIARPWIAALIVLGLIVASLFWHRRGRGGRRRAAEVERRPYHCLTIRLPPETTVPEPPTVLSGDPSVPAIWRKRGGAP